MWKLIEYVKIFLKRPAVLSVWIFWNGIIAQQQEGVSKKLKIHIAPSLERFDINNKPIVKNNEVGHVMLLC